MIHLRLVLWLHRFALRPQSTTILLPRALTTSISLQSTTSPPTHIHPPQTSVTAATDLISHPSHAAPTRFALHTSATSLHLSQLSTDHITSALVSHSY
ncbi:hypothetical protein EX30DRAFT_342801 [Ascodesmis nigricans]|uniref:REJ domain-containing protein n=1 Tax=Ascodesmis nigricans TaxID=341454 RepID=A0A4S2MP63_9PEZI|nr:hypothetical protein EX30DRAFT_342801 [Ascodesmis nigricans]